MKIQHQLDNHDMEPAVLEREWVITIDTPQAGVEAVTYALGKKLPLKQGPYDHCIFVRENGYQMFRALKGSHAGAEGTVQKTAAAQIIISIPIDLEILNNAFDVIFAVHVNEEPTIRVSEQWASRSKLLDDKDNPNRYWNRPDAKQLHGESVD